MVERWFSVREVLGSMLGDGIIFICLAYLLHFIFYCICDLLNLAFILISV